MQTAYDELPYLGAPFDQTHPDHLATLAILFGMSPAPVDRCSVLELGCGDGGNLIPMAFALPQSRFTGIDLAGSAIARGRQLIDEIKLTNIQLDQLDLMEIGPDFGHFDYIIAHGLYSWVPPQVREQILRICKSHLAPNGVAFISYNAYPGGHLRDTIREMMRFHTRQITGAMERVKQARELLEFLIEAHSETDTYSIFLRSELQSFLQRKPEHFYHDELGEYNNRFYVHQFVEDAFRHGLQYLSEARLLSMQTGVFGASTTENLKKFSEGDEVKREQYLDFVKLRNFRQTLLCHDEIKLDRTPRPDRVMKLWADSEAQPASAEPDVSSTAPLEFRYSKGGKMSTNHPLAKAAMFHLGSVWPEAVPVPELLRVARVHAGRDDPSAAAPLEEDSSWLSDMILKLYAANFLGLHAHPPVFTRTVSKRPEASALARAQIRSSSFVTNLRHAAVEVEDDAAKQLLTMLDGTRDQHQLLAELRAHAISGDITAAQLDAPLQRLAKLALLVA